MWTLILQQIIGRGIWESSAMDHQVGKRQLLKFFLKSRDTKGTSERDIGG